MEIKDVIEHEDGSATYVFDMTNEERNLMATEGVKLALLLGMCEMSYSEVVKIIIDSKEKPLG